MRLNPRDADVLTTFIQEDRTDAKKRVKSDAPEDTDLYGDIVRGHWYGGPVFDVDAYRRVLHRMGRYERDGYPIAGGIGRCGKSS